MRRFYVQMAVLVVVMLGTITSAWAVSCYSSATIVQFPSTQPTSEKCAGCGTKQACERFFISANLSCLTTGDTDCHGCGQWELWYYDPASEEQVYQDGLILQRLQGCDLSCGHECIPYARQDIYRCLDPGYTYTAFAWIFNVGCMEVGENTSSQDSDMEVFDVPYP